MSTTPNSANHWQVGATVFFEDAANTKFQGKVNLLLEHKLIASQEVTLHFNANGEASVRLESPFLNQVKPWYPNGVGEQYLYALTASLTEKQVEVSSKTIQIGFRTIEIVQNRLNSSDEAYSFYFTVNQRPIYAKGSNWIPAHVLPEKYDKEYVRDLLISTRLANMNMLRVWGGGFYEEDWFYELADQLGILIWHDMMFACYLYPNDPQFLASVSTEISQQVRRLQHHASIAVWAGNNEIEAAIAQFWYPQIFVNKVRECIFFFKS